MGLQSVRGPRWCVCFGHGRWLYLVSGDGSREVSHSVASLLLSNNKKRTNQTRGNQIMDQYLCWFCLLNLDSTSTSLYNHVQKANIYTVIVTDT